MAFDIQMSDRSNVLKLDIGTLSDFQKTLHFPSKKSDGLGDDKVESRFSAAYVKTSVSAHCNAKMPGSMSTSGTYVYDTPKKYDYLFKSKLKSILPKIRVKKEFESVIQICWSHNAGNNIVEKAHLLINDYKFTIDSVWLDIHTQFFEKPGVGKRETHKDMIGSVPFLTQWTNFLPAYPLSIPQPWFYSQHESKALPLLQSNLNYIKHEYKFRLQLDKLLRMRMKGRDGKWRIIKFNKKYIIGPEKIPVPELWGRFSLLSDQERKWRQSKQEEIYIVDVEHTKSTNTNGFGSTVTIPLNSTSPCRSLFWVAENADSTKYNGYSNYSTDKNNNMLGWNPCAKSGIQYSSSERVPKSDNTDFDQYEPYEFFPSTPDEPGYNAYSFGYNATTINADTSVLLKKLDANLVVDIDNIDPYISNDIYEYDENGQVINIEPVNYDKSQFIIHVKMLVCKKITVKWMGKDRAMKYEIE